MIIMNIIHTLVGVIAVSDPMWRVGLSLYSQVCINILCIYIFRKYLCSIKELRLFNKKNLKCCMWAMLIGVGVCLGHRIFFLFFMGFVKQSLQDIGETVITNQMIFLATVPGLLYETLLGPVTEEFFFRGIIFSVARQKHGNLYAIIISSLFFALGHLNGVQFISALFMGVVIGYTIILTGNVYIGVVIHVVNNSFALFNANILNNIWGIDYNSGIIQIIFGIILLVFGILMLRREADRKERYS